MNEQKKARKSVIGFIFKVLFFATLLGGLIGYTIQEFTLPNERDFFSYDCYLLEDDWTLVNEDSTETPLEVPGRVEAERGETIIIRHKVTRDMARYGAVCIRGARQDIQVYVDKKRVAFYSTQNTRPYGTSSAACYLIVRIEHRDVGRTLEVHLETDSAYTGVIRTAYYGTPEGIQRYLLFKEHGPEVFSGFALFILSLLTLLIATSFSIAEKKFNNVIYLSLGVLLAAIWCIANSPLGQILTRNLSATSDLNFFAMMLIPVPILIYINDIQNRRYQIAYRITVGLCLLDVYVCSYLQIKEIMDFKDTYLFGFGTLALAISEIIITIVMDARKRLLSEYIFVGVGFIGVGASGALMMGMYMSRSINFNGTPLALGFNFLLIMSLIKTIQDLVRRERERETAIQSGRMKADFLANMSHEIRTPMNAILGMNEIILRDTKEEETREHAKDIEAAGKSLLALVNDVLDFSKIDSGKIELVSVEYSTRDMIIDCRNLLEKRAEDKGLELKVEADPKLPATLRGDENRIRQIITNILSNAVKYTETGSVTITYGQKRSSIGEFIFCVTVKDTGIGIKPENLDRVFDSFQRLELKRNRSIEGTGLGLSITKHLVELMHGRIWVESVLGEGSTFFVEVPQTVIGMTAIGKVLNRAEEKKSTEKVFRAPDARVLVVDDVEMNLKVATGLLKKTKVQVDCCLSGEECLKLTAEQKYDLIFLDHMMPDMDGMETFARFREMENNPNADTPVIMLTANAIAGAKEEYENSGFADYLAKPFRFEEIRDMMIKHLPKEKQVYE
jgi:signal transduction histidine kinase/CheY-like chemotaxis protein